PCRMLLGTGPERRGRLGLVVVFAWSGTPQCNRAAIGPSFRLLPYLHGARGRWLGGGLGERRGQLRMAEPGKRLSRAVPASAPLVRAHTPQAESDHANQAKPSAQGYPPRVAGRPALLAPSAAGRPCRRPPRPICLP